MAHHTWEQVHWLKQAISFFLRSAFPKYCIGFIKHSAANDNKYTFDELEGYQVGFEYGSKTSFVYVIHKKRCFGVYISTLLFQDDPCPLADMSGAHIMNQISCWQVIVESGFDWLLIKD